MKDIIASQIQTRRSSGSPRLGLTFGLAVLLPALVLSMVFTTSAQPTEDLKITVNFTPDRPVTPDTNIELRLSRALKEGEGRIAVIINHSDITSLFVIDGTRLPIPRLFASRAASVATTCISFLKVGYACPKPGSKAGAQSRSPNKDSVRTAQPGGDASTPQSGHSQPEPSPGGSTGGNEASGPSAPLSPPASPVSENANPPEAKQPIRETVTPVLEGVHELVCSLPLPLCPK